MKTALLILVLYVLPMFISYLIAVRLEGAVKVKDITNHLPFILFPIVNIAYILMVGGLFCAFLFLKSYWLENFKETKLP